MKMAMAVPDGLRDLLRDFTVGVLRRRPSDLYEFAVEYFTLARQQRRGEANSEDHIDEDDRDESDHSDDDFMVPPVLPNHFHRRKSVSAERYDPETETSDDSDDGKSADRSAIYPKSDSQRRLLAESVCDILIFRSLEKSQINHVIDAMFERSVAAGEKVIVEGDDGDNFYVIQSGTYDVYIETAGGTNKHIHRFEEHGNFGELALLYNQRRSASVVAGCGGGVLWVMDRRCFRRIVLRSAFRQRRVYEQLLASLPLLHRLDPYERMNVADALVTREFDDGACVIRQDEPADGLYFVESGRVRVTLTGDNGAEVDIDDDGRQPLKYFGEMALVENERRSASVYARGHVRLAFLERASFERLLGPCVDIMKRNFDVYQRHA